MLLNTQHSLIITNLYEISRQQSLLKEDFKNNKRKWEIVDIDTEYSAIKEAYYYMENKSSSQWNYYKNKSTIKPEDFYTLDTEIELLSAGKYGHFGLVWGFDKEREVINRFSLSADGTRAVIMQFEKDHRRIYHRFQTRNIPKINFKNPVRLTIIKLGEYLYFLINKINVYMAHESQFINDGPYFGYYIEPELSIRSKYIEITKIKASPIEVDTGFNQLIR